MNTITCYVDKYGSLRAKTEPRSEILGMYLEQDIQCSLNGCDELIGICNQVKRKEEPEWSGTGNAHTLTICEQHVTIENEYDDSLDPMEISLSEFIEALKEWKRCIGKYRETES